MVRAIIAFRAVFQRTVNTNVSVVIAKITRKFSS